MQRLIIRALLVVALVAAAGLGTLAATRTAQPPAAPPSGAFRGDGINAGAKAVNASTSFDDVVTIYSSRNLSATVAGPAINAANQVGAAAVVSEGATIPLVKVFRGGQLIRTAAPGYRWGLASSAVPTDAVGRIMNRDIAAALGGGAVVVGQVTASLHGIQAGDVLELLGGNNAPFRVPVAAIGSDATIGGTEMLLSTDLFHGLVYNRPTQVLIWGFGDRKALDNALAANGLVRPDVRILHSWDSPNPDSTLSTGRLKAALGEFQYAGGGDSITPEAAWRNAYIARYALPVGGSSINTWCNKNSVPGYTAALAEVTQRGLAGAIDLANTNRYGGCYGPREVRPDGGTTGGSLSRHSWGAALDMNTVSNCMGCVPQMNCTVVQIFRKYGFAWGGNYLTADGMHFEYVGERRDQLSYPSRFCPNVAGVTQSALPAGTPADAKLPPAPARTDSRDLMLAPPSLGEPHDEPLEG